MPASKTDQNKSGQPRSQNVKLELSGLNSTLLKSDYITIFNMLTSIAQLEISKTNSKIYKNLSRFIKNHEEHFSTHEKSAFKRYLGNLKRYFKPGMFRLNKRAKKIINRFFSITNIIDI